MDVPDFYLIKTLIKFSTFFNQIGLVPTSDHSVKNGCGFTMVPEPELGEGYLWTYPVNPFCSITIYHLKYYT